MDIKQMLANFSEKWRSLSQTRKTMAVLSAVGLLIVLVVLGQVLFRTPYAPLFTGLDPKDAGKITEELKKEKIPYRITDQGKTIEVPESQVYETRNRLASNGALYSSGVGFELFDQTKYGVTEFEQQVGYQRALQEELRRTIVQIDSVEQARVHLVMPKKSLFLDEQTEPSASIALQIKPGATISSENVKGIMELVAGSVEGLKPENIHIIDMSGNSLSDGLMLGDKNAGLNKAALDRNEIRRNFEKELETRIQNMLRQILGPGMAVAMVTADLNFDQEQYKANTYDKGQTLSEQSVTETGTGSSGAGGAPGTDSQLPGQSVPAASGAGGGSSYSRQETTTNYQVPSREETVIKAPGSTRRLSVSVVLNGNYSEAQKLDIQKMVETAIGYDSARGDQVNVSCINFDDTEQKAIDAEMQRQQDLEDRQKQYIIYGLIAAGALLLLLLLIMVIAGRRRRRAEMEAQLRKLDEQKGLFVDVEDGEIEMPREDTKQDKIKKLASENPDEVAEILKLWLKE